MIRVAHSGIGMVDVELIPVRQAVRVGVLIAVTDAIPVGISFQRLSTMDHLIAVT